MGVPESSRPGDVLASGDLALAYARLPSLWFEPGRASPDEPAISFGERAAAVCAAPAVDRRVLAQRVCGSNLRDSSVASGYCRLGHRTEKSSERIILDADAPGLFAIRPQTRSWALCAPAAAIHHWPDVQACFGGVARRDALARYLATAEVGLGARQLARKGRGTRSATKGPSQVNVPHFRKGSADLV